MTDDAVTVSARRSAEVVRLRTRHEYATFIIDESPVADHAGGYYCLAIESTFGGFAFAWTHPGVDFRVFLCKLHRDYVTGKMVGETQVPDWEETQKELKRELLQRRRRRELSADAARGEWQLLNDCGFDGEVDFWLWARDSEEFDCVHEYIATQPSPRAREFMKLYDLFWPAFAKAIAAEAPNGK